MTDCKYSEMFFTLTDKLDPNHYLVNRLN